MYVQHNYFVCICLLVSGWWFVHMDDFNEGWVPATYLEPVYGESDHQVIHLEPGDGEKEKRGRAWGHYVGVMDERMMGGGEP